jgi:hypothetical protein
MTDQNLHRNNNTNKITARAAAPMAFALLLYLSGCSAPVEVDFLVNGTVVDERESPPVSVADTVGVYVIAPGDTVQLYDVSRPAGKVKKRYWNNVQGQWDQEESDTATIEVSFDAPGDYGIVLCINDRKQCTTRWIRVRPVEVPEPIVEPLPVVEPPKPDPPVVVAAPIRPKPLPPPPPPKKKPEIPFEGKSGEVGARHSGSSTDCQTETGSSFRVALKVKQAVELGSLVVYANHCGGVNVSLAGPNTKVNFRAILVPGFSQIDLGAHVAERLQPGDYQLSGEAFSGGANCDAADTPRFKRVNGCPGAGSANSPALELDQKGNLIIHQLKFTY